jgi:hypothetical protein
VHSVRRYFLALTSELKKPIPKTKSSDFVF